MTGKYCAKKVKKSMISKKNNKKGAKML